MSDSDWNYEAWAEMQKMYGRKTINDLRAEAGMAAVKGGEIAMMDWMKQCCVVPLRPHLRVVPVMGDDHGE